MKKVRLLRNAGTSHAGDVCEVSASLAARWFTCGIAIPADQKEPRRAETITADADVEVLGPEIPKKMFFGSKNRMARSDRNK